MDSQKELARAQTHIVQSRIELDVVRQELQALQDSSRTLVELRDQQVRFEASMNNFLC